MRPVFFILLLSLSLAARADTFVDVAKVLGPGLRLNDGGYRAVKLRSDLQIQNHAGMLISPEMGLESTVEVSSSKAAGELCVLYEEIGPVVDLLREGGFDLTGLGNRLGGETPTVYFLQFTATGEPVKLANCLKNAMGEMGRERLISEGLQRTGQPPVVDWKAASVIVGRQIEEIGSSRVMQAHWDHGWVRFGGCPCGRTQALVSVSCGPPELQTVIDAGRMHRLTVTSILRSASAFDLVFQGEGDALSLAAGARSVWVASKRELESKSDSGSGGAVIAWDTGSDR